MGPFEKALTAFAIKAEGAIDQTVREVVFECGRTLIALSPVDTSSFASNWYYSAVSPGTLYQPDARNRFELNRADKMPSKGAGRIAHFIYNRAPYGPALERGHSKRAPQGFVVLTTLAFPNIVANAATRARVRGAAE